MIRTLRRDRPASFGAPTAMTNRLATLPALAALLPVLLAGCTGLQTGPFPEPIRPPKPLPSAAPEAGVAPAEAATAIELGPSVTVRRHAVMGTADSLGQDLAGDPIGPVKFNGAPLGAFINEVFGDLLGLSFHMAPGLAERPDLVTMGVNEALPPSEFFATARRVLRQYGIDIVQEGALLSFEANDNIASGDVPLLISGRARPEVPATHRAVFQVVPLRAAQANFMMQLLAQIFGDQLQVEPIVGANLMLLRGSGDMVDRAVRMIELLDQPRMAGQRAIVVKPVFLSAQELAEALAAVLRAEGYHTAVGSAGGVSVALLPLEATNQLVAFARDAAALDLVEQWARTLDTERQGAIDNAWFTYQVRHTQASALTDTLNGMLALERGEEAADPGAAGQRQRPDRAQSGLGGEEAAGGGSGRQGRFVVDENRNMLLFRGSGREWGNILAVLEELDQPVPSVLIELLVAEVTTRDERGAGVEFLFKSGVGDLVAKGTTIGRLGLGERGFSLPLDSAGQTRAMLNLFYEDSRVAIRSNARLVVKSGATGSFDVGNEIPTIFQSSASGVQVEGTSAITQQVQYRKTGVLLTITPTVQANGLVDIAIENELSEARPTAGTSITGSPTILRRALNTSLTLRDGGSLLMGGLTSINQSDGDTGVPGLGRIPLLGRLFRGETFQEDRTELVVLVIPYVIASHEEGLELTRRIQQQLELHQRYAAPPGTGAGAAAGAGRR